MKHDVLKIDRQIHQQQRCPKGRPIGEIEMIQEAPASFMSEKRNTYRHQRKEEAGRQVVEQNDAEVVGPAEFPGKTQDSARGRGFPGAHQNKDGEEESEPYQNFVAHGNI